MMFRGNHRLVTTKGIYNVLTPEKILKTIRIDKILGQCEDIVQR